MSSASRTTTRSSSSSLLPPTRRRRHISNGGAGGGAAAAAASLSSSSSSSVLRNTRSSAKRKRDDDDDVAGGGAGRGSGSGSSDGGEDDVGQRRQKRQRRTSPTGSASAAAASVAKKKTKKTKKKRPQDANDADEDTDGGELKVGTTLTFGGHGSSSGGNGTNQIVNDENMSGNAHNMSITVRIVRTLGSGVHGRVYLVAEEAGDGDDDDDNNKTKKYVLKVPMATEEDVREAQIEIRALEALKGVSGVVQLVASSTVSSSSSSSSSSDTVCLLLKHVEGQVMEEYIEQRGRLPLSEAWGLMKQLVATLVEMKKKAGLCHLDIKPDNCLVTTTATTGTSKDQRLVLFDYGTARPCDRPTSDDLGSIFFDAPEICRGQKKTDREPYDPLPADMYSVARTFLVALVGYHPRSSSSDKAGGGGEEGDWWEEDTFGTVGEHIGSIRERCPAAADLLEQLLHSDPTQRPTAEQALEALTNRPWE